MTSSIDIAAARHGVRYIPAHEILAKTGASFEIPLARGRLIPDQLFALDYGDSFLAFALEVDRGTEPLQSSAARKSLKRSIEQYSEVLERGLHRSHYGLKANLIVLWVFMSRIRQARFVELLEQSTHAVVSAMVSKAVRPAIFRSGPSDVFTQDAWTSGSSREFRLI